MGSAYSQIKDITRLPVQNSDQIYLESSPVVISDNDIMIFFISNHQINNANLNDTLYSSRSTDGGSTWHDKSFITEIKNNPDHKPSYLTALRTTSGRIIIAFTDWDIRKMAITFSDDNGYNWSTYAYVEGGGRFPYPRNTISNLRLSALLNGRIILSFSGEDLNTAYYRESLDDGAAWSDSAYVFYTGSDNIKESTFISVNTDTIAAIFELHGPDNYGIFQRTSSDGGESWSIQRKVINTGMIETRPRLVKISENDISIVFEVSDTTNTLTSLNDIYFVNSSDGGVNWGMPQRFTSYAGKDTYVNAALLNDKPLITFSTTRFTNTPQIAYAVLGETVETFKPPYIVSHQTFSDSANRKTFILKCKIIDDQSVNNVSLVTEIGGSTTLYDDGNHNDDEASDNIFGNVINLDQIPPSQMAIMNANKITLALNNKGVIAYSYPAPSYTITAEIIASDNDHQQTVFDTLLNIEYQSFNQFDESSFLFSGGFLLSGYSNGTMWANGIASSILLEDYLPGKVGSERNNQLNKVYVIKKEDSPFGYSWQQWKNAVSLGAEFYDGDGDGVYDPVDKNWNGTWDKNEDMPMLIGDETAWCVYNDGLPNQRRRWNNVCPQGIEVKQTVFASDLPELENTIFIRYSILNTGTVTDFMDSVYFGLWADPDLGNASDDLIGCDTLLNSGFVYNDSTDYLYGPDPPSFFMSLLQGPVVNTDNSMDTAYVNNSVMYGQQEIPGWTNLDLVAHIFCVGGIPIVNDPNNEIIARNYLQGKTSVGEYPDPCTFSYMVIRGGENCVEINPAFWTSGDPVTDIGWFLEFSGDFRNMISTGPFTLEKDKTQEIIAAYVVGRGTGPINSITAARNNVRRAVNEYKSNFSSMTYQAPPPTNPVVNYQLYHNYPNPFNPVTRIRYEIPQNGVVKIDIYDILGQKVKTILNKFQAAGRYEVEFNGSSFASGIYIYRMQVNDFISSKKMVLIK